MKKISMNAGDTTDCAIRELLASSSNPVIDEISSKLADDIIRCRDYDGGSKYLQEQANPPTIVHAELKRLADEYSLQVVKNGVSMYATASTDDDAIALIKALRCELRRVINECPLSNVDIFDLCFFLLQKDGPHTINKSQNNNVDTEFAFAAAEDIKALRAKALRLIEELRKERERRCSLWILKFSFSIGLISQNRRRSKKWHFNKADISACESHRKGLCHIHASSLQGIVLK